MRRMLAGIQWGPPENGRNGASDAAPVSSAQHEVHFSMGVLASNGAIRLRNSPSKHVHSNSENLPENLKGVRSGPRLVDGELPPFRGAHPPENPRRRLAQRFVENFEVRVATQTGEKRSEAAVTAPLRVQNPWLHAAFWRTKPHFRITKLRALDEPVPRRPKVVRRAFRRNAGWLLLLFGA